MKSDFERIVPEDFKQFRDVSSRFQKVQMENIAELNELCITAWLLACRWSEIESLSNKIAKENEISKTDFQTWSYQKYSLLKEMHITLRSWHRIAKEELLETRKIEGI